MAPPSITGSSSLFAAWSRVATCEEGGWSRYGFPAYPDSIGIDAANWEAFGGTSDLSPAAQIAVGERLVNAYGIAIPDAYGCSSW